MAFDRRGPITLVKISERRRATSETRAAVAVLMHLFMPITCERAPHDSKVIALGIRRACMTFVRFTNDHTI
jgi:hypothetical protein